MAQDKARATKVTDAKLAAAKLPDGKAEARILAAPGLYLHLRRRAGGEVAKHWQYRAQVAGVRRWLSLGAYPAVSLAKANADLLEHQKAHEAAKKGEADHPVIAARFARRANVEMPTVAQAFDDWIADKRLGSKRKDGRPVRERTITILTENFDADIRARIGDAKISKLTPEAIRACIDAPRKRGAPGAAAHVYRTLRGLVTFAIKRQLIDGADPMRGIDNPKPYRPAPVNAASDAELVALLRAVDESDMHEATKLAIEFQLLTGARPGEVRLAEWREFNLDRALWTIPASRVKTDREFRVHLSDAALVLLKRAKALRNDQKSTFVFPGAKGGTMDKMAIAHALRRLAERVEAKGGKRLRPHDLRRTFRTMLSRLGVQPHVAELCMNHQETETMRRVYDGHDYSGEVAAAWDAAGAHIKALRAGGALVIPMTARRA
ncbi:MAG: tyrosine-type recombinase/integrase [Rubrivivax sp.]|nr:tyrosine-type recombinase/integrase [Rubrivivax sp.]